MAREHVAVARSGEWNSRRQRHGGGVNGALATTQKGRWTHPEALRIWGIRLLARQVHLMGGPDKPYGR